MLNGANFKLEESFTVGSVSVKMNNLRFLLFSIIISELADEIVQSSDENICIAPDIAEIMNFDFEQFISFADRFGLNIWTVHSERFCRRRSSLINEPGA